jgi:hypothetical protein
MTTYQALHRSCRNRRQTESARTSRVMCCDDWHRY